MNPFSTLLPHLAAFLFWECAFTALSCIYLHTYVWAIKPLVLIFYPTLDFTLHQRARPGLWIGWPQKQFWTPPLWCLGHVLWDLEALSCLAPHHSLGRPVLYNTEILLNLKAQKLEMQSPPETPFILDLSMENISWLRIQQRKTVNPLKSQ